MTAAEFSGASPKDQRQAEYFANRLRKNERNLRRWARREGVEALRLYDVDIPEVPLAVDRYGTGADAALVIALYERPYAKDDREEAAWLDLMAARAASTLEIPRDAVFLKTRRRLRGEDQYEKEDERRVLRVVRENGLAFIVNLSDYLDTGLFLDHRPTRALVRDAAKDREVLNLFAYTGSFSVYAAAGGARSVTSVDLSNTYLAWAARNLEQNGFSGDPFPLVRSDVSAFLAAAQEAGRTWDLIVADPPTFSNSKRARADFDVNRDWPGLLAACSRSLRAGGKIFFSTNSRHLVWDGAKTPLPWKDIGQETIPPDFRDRKIHRAWVLGDAVS